MEGAMIRWLCLPLIPNRPAILRRSSVHADFLEPHGFMRGGRGAVLALGPCQLSADLFLNNRTLGPIAEPLSADRSCCGSSGGVLSISTLWY